MPAEFDSARWRSGNAGVCKTSTAPVRFRHAPQNKNFSSFSNCAGSPPEADRDSGTHLNVFYKLTFFPQKKSR